MLRRAAKAYAAWVAFFALYVSQRAFREHFTVLHYDDWRIFADLFSSGSLVDWLFRSHNGHRVPGTLLLAWLDYEYFKGRMDLMVAATLVCAFAALLALWAVWSGASYAFVWGMREISGWAWHPHAGAPPLLIVVADSRDVIRGLGIFPTLTSVRRASVGRRRWFGYLADYDPATPYRVFAVLSDRRSACPLLRPGGPEREAD